MAPTWFERIQFAYDWLHVSNVLPSAAHATYGSDANAIQASVKNAKTSNRFKRDLAGDESVPMTGRKLRAHTHARLQPVNRSVLTKRTTIGLSDYFV